MKIADKWFSLLQPEFDKEHMQGLKTFLNKEMKNFKVFPPKEKIFRAIEATDYDDVKVVIIGQDPYHGSNQANGLCFAVHDGITTPPSLRNIFKEIESDIGTRPQSTELVGWAEQGVLLLNTVLTVRAHSANSHRCVGWEQFTDKIISHLNEREEPVAFLLWGSSARNKKSLITNDKHLILESSHPSPLSAYRGFLGCKHFSKVNDWLLETYGEAIDWSRS